ncbi:MAG: hypothetical protein WC527_04510 [Candidatus Margulisiibacteriota bacterium]
MRIATVFMRSINLVRSAQIRMQSPYTSGWGLARLSLKATTPAMKQDVYHNIRDRITSGTIDMASLYNFDRTILKEAFVRASVPSLAKLVATATPGRFEFTFKGKGIDEIEMIDLSGKAKLVKCYYEKECTKKDTAYNILFFIWMRETLGRDKWNGILAAIKKPEKLLVDSLTDLEGKLIEIHERLIKKYPLPTKHDIGIA